MPDLPELQQIKDASISTLRLEGTLTKRLPGMPSGDLKDLGFTDFKRQEAEKTMNDMRVVYDISRQQSKRSRAISRAKNRQAQRAAEGR